MDVELKPCPWCGEKLTSIRVSEGSTFRWRKVDGCCTDGPEVRHNTLADDQAAAEADSTRRAIEAWNTRHDHSPDAGGMGEDAARYRWLKEKCQHVPDEYGTAGQLYFGTYAGGELDAAIDAARAGERG